VHGYTTQAFVAINQTKPPKVMECALKAARAQLAAVLAGAVGGIAILSAAMAPSSFPRLNLYQYRYQRQCDPSADATVVISAQLEDGVPVHSIY